MCTPVYTKEMTTQPPRLGTRELRLSLASSLRRAAAGERIVVTDAGRPLAQLGPLDSPGHNSMDELVARGLVIAPRRAQGNRPLNALVDTPIDVFSGMRLDQMVRDLR